jgi:hypothetical protein
MRPARGGDRAPPCPPRLASRGAAERRPREDSARAGPGRRRDAGRATGVGAAAVNFYTKTPRHHRDRRGAQCRVGRGGGSGRGPPRPGPQRPSGLARPELVGGGGTGPCPAAGGAPALARPRAHADDRQRLARQPRPARRWAGGSSGCRMPAQRRKSRAAAGRVPGDGPDDQPAGGLNPGRARRPRRRVRPPPCRPSPEWQTPAVV